MDCRATGDRSRGTAAPSAGVGLRARLGSRAALVGALFFSLATLLLHNDHFHRIAAARQIAAYGELPFRDFLDPGFFLTESSSAALQRTLGDNLLGEGLLTSVFIATGTLLVFVLARRATSSTIAGIATAVLALLALPRAYDCDKVLFYPLGVLLCWRYVDRPTPARVVALATGLVAGALYRYDTGVHIGGAAVVAMAIVHAGDLTHLGLLPTDSHRCHTVVEPAARAVVADLCQIRDVLDDVNRIVSIPVVTVKGGSPSGRDPH